MAPRHPLRPPGPPAAQHKRPGPVQASPAAPRVSPTGPRLAPPAVPPPVQAKRVPAAPPARTMAPPRAPAVRPVAAQAKRPSGPVPPPVRPVAPPRPSTVPLPAAQAKRGPVFAQRPSAVRAHPVRRSAPPPVPAQHPSRAGTVQARYQIQGRGNEEGLFNRLLAMDREQTKQLGAERLRECMGILRASKIHHGAVDVENEQQVALLYWNAVRVSKRFGDQFDNRVAALRQDIEEFDASFRQDINRLYRMIDIYQLAIIGAGSSTAYYIDTLGPAYDHSSTLLIGNANPWSGERGLVAIDFINHTEGQIGYPSQGVPAYTDQFLGRAEFADRTRRIITDAIPVENRFDEKILSIDKEDGLYVIRSRDGLRTKTRKARKVVVATGAGPHSPTTAQIDSGADRVMDMDRFVRDVAVNGEKTTRHVVVQGPNAAIDAVAAAQRCGWSVYWFINSSTPVYLPGTRYYLGRVPLYKASDVKIQTRDNGTLDVQANVQPYTGGDHQYAYDKNAWGGKADRTFNVDYFVYGIGQNINAEGSAGQFLSQGIRDSLRSIYDRSGRYSEVQDDDFGYVYGTQVALGLRTQGSTADSGLEIIGAAAKALATKPQQGELGKVTGLLTADVLAYEQLGGIRSAMHGLNEYVPSSIVRDVDFSNADPTTLRMYIMLNYPDVSERDARDVINTILRHRKTGHHPHGYDDWWINHWKQVLATRNEWGRRR